jgi:nitrate reductase molybdenum cofactor assembly chaperone NarJ/NarW
MSWRPGRRRPPYKLFSLLLQYPDRDLLGARPELGAAIGELPKTPEREALDRFYGYFNSTATTLLQQEYVETFDLQKRSSLYLTFYTDGDTRKRGLALLRLKRLYRAAGLTLESQELPDYLPVMLEFAEHAPKGVGARLLAEHRRGLELLRLHLRELESPYRHLLEGICAGLPGLSTVDLEAVGRLLSEGPPTEQVGLQPFAPPEVMPLIEVRR